MLFEVADGVVFFGGDGESCYERQFDLCIQKLHAVDAATGEAKWTYLHAKVRPITWKIDAGAAGSLVCIRRYTTYIDIVDAIYRL